MNIQGMTEFIDAGGNLLVTGSSNTGEVLREIASECGFEVSYLTITFFVAVNPVYLLLAWFLPLRKKI